MRGTNSQGSDSFIDCAIPTYDITPPTIRVRSGFRISSNPHVIEGSYRGHDDSVVTKEMFAFGLGRGKLDDQISAWKTFKSNDVVKASKEIILKSLVIFINIAV